MNKMGVFPIHLFTHPEFIHHDLLHLPGNVIGGPGDLRRSDRERHQIANPGVSRWNSIFEPAGL